MGLLGRALLHYSNTPPHRLSERGLHFGFLNQRCANLFAELHQFDLAMLGEASASWDEVAHDHVFLETAQPVDFA